MTTVALVLLSAFIHAGWNLLVRSHDLSRQMLRIPLLISAVAVGPVLWLELRSDTFPSVVWLLLAVSGLFQALYYLGLALGYQHGDFTVVYPLVRALPVLFVALFDLARGQPPSTGAWLGLCLVTVGCLLIPHTTWRTLHWRAYRSQTLAWVAVAAVGTVGYSAVDKIAAELITPGPTTAARYFVWQLIACLLPFGVGLRLLGQPLGLRPWNWGWLWAGLAGMGTFASYWLILWAYQSATHASYVVAMRQLSIVLGAVAGSLLFHEPARGLRIPAALSITVGIVLIAVLG